MRRPVLFKAGHKIEITTSIEIIAKPLLGEVTNLSLKEL